MFQIKEITAAEIPVIQELVEKIWRPTYQSILDKEQIEYMVELMYSTATLTKQFDQGQHFLLLYDGDFPIGYASYASTNAEGVYKLHKIYVHGDYQGKGVGRLFINAVIDAVKGLDGKMLELDVNRYNKAKLFYEKIGFSVFKEKDVDIGNGYFMNDYEMRKVL